MVSAAASAMPVKKSRSVLRRTGRSIAIDILSPPVAALQDFDMACWPDNKSRSYTHMHAFG
jgi:hypothetical protein